MQIKFCSITSILEAFAAGCLVVLGEATLADAPRELFLDAGFAGVRALDADVGEEDLVAYGGGDLRDARAHLARSEYADRLDVVECDAHLCRSLPRLGGRVCGVLRARSTVRERVLSGV